MGYVKKEIKKWNEYKDNLKDVQMCTTKNIEGIEFHWDRKYLKDIIVEKEQDFEPDCPYKIYKKLFN